MIRSFSQNDLSAVIRLWNAAVDAGEVVFSLMTEDLFTQKFLHHPNADPSLYFVAEEEGILQGFVLGMEKKSFLPKETAQSTPGYLLALFVSREYRGRGVGRALLARLEAAFQAHGKELVSCGGAGPVDLPWCIPGTPGHDHNSVPGMDESCAGYPFLQSLGYHPVVHEVALYLDLNDYRPLDGLAEKRARLEAEGIQVGPYEAALEYDYDGMCDRVGSEYWRAVLRSEIACHLAHRPNPDPQFWVDGLAPAGPRPILTAVCHPAKAIVAQAGPVAVQRSGRGWFTGICTDPLYEKKGIATVLFNALMQEFIAQGAQFSTIFTGAENHARKVYERTGFRPVRSFAIMRKSLSAN
ncbi:MAG: GNAT family N-acetyltransferase [Clostridia bacterium]|nr:GNAT family N-acetyltransferase [Clostridia bacterium]